ncbi:MAG: hypothetical protein HYU80_04725 [Candidatus Blackburnbacteria bacterium]|nr:hypothetical protein [Candidatus Blackburnbacteria bacterium]
MYTADRPRRMDRRVFGLALVTTPVAVVACESGQTTTPDAVRLPGRGGPTTTPTRRDIFTPRIESILSSEKPSGASWEARIGGASFVLPEGEVGKDTPKSPAVIYAENRVFVRAWTGYGFILDAKTGNSLWKSPTTGAFLGADASRFVFLSESDFKVQVYEAAYNRPVGEPILPAASPASREQMSKYWRFPVRIGEKVIAIPRGETIAGGTFDGFVVVDKSDGKVIFENPKDGAHHKILDFIGNNLIVGSGNTVRVYDVLSGQVIEEMPAVARPRTRDQYVFARFRDWFVVLGKAPETRQKSEPGIMSVYDTKNRKLLAKEVLAQGDFFSAFRLPSSAPDCYKDCKANHDRIIFETRTSQTAGGILELEYVTILAEMQLDPAWLSVKYGSSGIGVVLASGAVYVGGPYIQRPNRYTADGSLLEGATFVVRDTYYATNYLNGTGDVAFKNWEDNKRYVFVQTYKGFSGMYDFREYPAVRMVGKFGDNVVAATWDNSLPEKQSGAKKLYAFNPSVSVNKPVWERDLQTTKDVKILLHNNAIYVATESLLKISPDTGIPEPVAYLGATVSQVFSTGSHIIVETSDNRLISFPIPS